MKKLLCVLLLLSLALSLTSCSSGDVTVTPAESASTPSPEGQDIADASTPEELQALLEEYRESGNYSMALAAAQKLLELEPTDTLYAVRAELQILILKADYETLNDMLEEDVGSVSDPTAYKDTVAQLYEQACLALQIPFVPDYASEEEINTVGNTSANLLAGIWEPDYSVSHTGVFASQGDWIYYAVYSENFALYKVRLDGTDKQLLCTDGACNLNVLGDWIYFSNVSDSSRIYKMRTDGTQKTKITEDACSGLCITGDWIYYRNESDSNAIYRMKTDGSGREPFGKTASTVYIDGDWYYFASPDETYFLRGSLEGGDPEVILQNQQVRSAQVYGDWVYYINSTAIMKAQLDGSEQSQVLAYDGKINYFVLADDRLIASVRADGNHIIAYDLNTMEQLLQLDTAYGDAICTASDGSVYFANALDNNAFYRINWEAGTAEVMG